MSMHIPRLGLYYSYTGRLSHHNKKETKEENNNANLGSTTSDANYANTEGSDRNGADILSTYNQAALVSPSSSETEEGMAALSETEEGMAALSETEEGMAALPETENIMTVSSEAVDEIPVSAETESEIADYSQYGEYAETVAKYNTPEDIASTEAVMAKFDSGVTRIAEIVSNEIPVSEETANTIAAEVYAAGM